MVLRGLLEVLPSTAVNPAEYLIKISESQLWESESFAF